MYDPKNQQYASSVKRLRPVMEAEQEKTKEEMLGTQTSSCHLVDTSLILPERNVLLLTALEI